MKIGEARTVAEELRAEYASLVIQVASLLMRRAINDEYANVRQLALKFADDVTKCSGAP